MKANAFDWPRKSDRNFVGFVLDEPIHWAAPKGQSEILDTLSALRNLGNTVLVVEHDEETIRRADYVVDLDQERELTAER